MPNLNKVLLMGNLTRDPELRVLPKGTPICGFGLAINRKFKAGDGGEEREEVIFVDCEAWGKTGETIAKYCAKGKPLYVEGRLKLDQWEDKTTHEKKSRMKVVVENFQFLGGKDGESHARPSEERNQGASNPPPTQSQPRETQGTLGNRPPLKHDGLDEDVPF